MAGKYQSPSKKKPGVLIILAIVLVACVCTIVVRKLSQDKAPTKPEPQSADVSVDITPGQTETEPPETEVPPTEPHTKLATATIGATGDLLLHDTVIKSGYDRETKTYNYDDIFTWFTKYVSRVDYAAANLEVTLNSNDNGFPYSGYPCFNSPDAIVDAAKNAGFDLLLTANNHTYDMGWSGFTRTQEVIEDRELDHVGSRLKAEDKSYLIREINDIKVAMTCYTYCTGYTGKGGFMLNGIALSLEASELVNAYHYRYLDRFYDKLSGEIGQMKADGAEAIVMFIHWGTEYKTKPNEYQLEISQKLCDLGVDVIVGNHAHVVQPVELLTSRTDENHRTLCLYSTGNSIANIRRSGKFPPHAEDGMFFTFTFAKYSDGSVLVESAEVLPTWVWTGLDEKGYKKFRIMAMDPDTDWKTEMNLDEELTAFCEESIDRTNAIVGEGLAAANTWFAEKQAEKETALGIR